MTTHPRASAGDPPTRALDPAEQLAWQEFTGAVRGLFDALEKQLQADSDLPMTYFEVLVALSEAPDRRLRMGDLARRLGSSSSRLSHAIARLEEASLVRREQLPSDRRGAVALLTDAGAEALAEALPGHVGALRSHLFDHLTAEQVTQLTEISRAVQAGIPVVPAPRRRAEDRGTPPHAGRSGV